MRNMDVHEPPFTYTFLSDEALEIFYGHEAEDDEELYSGETPRSDDCRCSDRRKREARRESNIGLDETLLDTNTDYEAESSAGPIATFKAITVNSLALRTCTSRMSHFGGLFRIKLDFNSDFDCRRFEYRQDIKGTATITPKGALTPLDASECFNIPGSLSPKFKEDGEIIGGTRPTTVPAPGHFCNPVVGGRVERFGYRSAPAVLRTGTCPVFSILEDRYLSSQRHGCKYRAKDTYGLSVDTIVLSGATLSLRIVWRGKVIDTDRSDKVIRTLHWGVKGSTVIP
mgnify:CR=1 FL=1